jgi:hypothetical protein
MLRILSLVALATLIACVPPAEAPAPAATTTAIMPGYLPTDAEVTFDDRLANDMEAQALRAARMTLGKVSVAPQMPVPAPAAETIDVLRREHVKFEVSKLDWHTSIDLGFLQMQDDLQPRIAVLSRKATEGTITPAERTELTRKGKWSPRTGDLHMQFDQVARLAPASSQAVSVTLTQMTRTAGRLRHHPLSTWTDEDYAFVARDLARQARIDAAAASGTALLAAYRAVLEHDADPKGLTAMAEATLAALPVTRTYTRQEVIEYAKALPDDARKLRAPYEAAARQTWGEAEYEKTHKKTTDSLFAYADVGAEPSSTPAAAATASTLDKTLDLASTVTSMAGLGSATTALRGVQAVRNGDVHGAIDAAVQLAPVPALKEAWSVASSLLFRK